MSKVTGKLTTEIKEWIKDEAVRVSKANLDKFMKGEAQLADEIYQEMVAPETQKLLKKLPEGLINLQLKINIRISKEVVDQIPCRSRDWSRIVKLEMSETRAIPLGAVDSEHFSPELLKKFNEYAISRGQLMESSATVYSEVSGLINKVRTVESLLKIWPEAEELLPNADQVTSNVPSVAVSNLNSVLGLPKEKAA